MTPDLAIHHLSLAVSDVIEIARTDEGISALRADEGHLWDAYRRLGNLLELIRGREAA